MSTAEVAIRRPQRWDTPFGVLPLAGADLDRILAVAPFDTMDAEKFPKLCPLKGLLQNDARLVSVRPGDIVVRENDYGNSAFILLDGSLRVILESLSKSLLGRPDRQRKSLLATAVQNWLHKPIPEVRAYGSLHLDGALDNAQTGTRCEFFCKMCRASWSDTKISASSRGISSVN